MSLKSLGSPGICYLQTLHQEVWFVPDLPALSMTTTRIWSLLLLLHYETISLINALLHCFVHLTHKELFL